MKGSSSNSEEKENFKKMAEVTPYFFEDLTKTAEEAEKKLENYENSVDSSHRPTPNPSSTPPPPLSQNSAKMDNRVNQLEAEIGRIQQEIRKLGTGSAGDENKLKKKQLEGDLAAFK